MLELMALKRKPVSGLAALLPRYFIEKDKIARSAVEAEDPLAVLAEAYAGAPSDDSDGLKIMPGEKRWVHVRVSNTEPIIRMIAESRTREDARAMLDDIIRKLEG